MDKKIMKKGYPLTTEKRILCLGTAGGKTYESDTYDPDNLPDRLILHEKDNSIYMGYI